ncbi:MAG TPA: methyl-accepting chemotaxis protein [Methanospirillum sp.]|nr:methyl-accepting chemotaxis protein [Methanospirillum sp.]
MNFLKRLLLIMIGLSIIPLCILGMVTLFSLNGIDSLTAGQISDIGNKTVNLSTESLNQLGEQIILIQATDMARVIDLYITSNPKKTVADLQNDPKFLELINLNVGKTGYFAVLDKKSLINRVHPRQDMINVDFHTLKEKLPQFFGVLEKITSTDATGGYYNWVEADGSIRQKYMYIVSTRHQTADGVTLAAVATTYIDEFSAPATILEEKLLEENIGLQEKIGTYIGSIIVLLVIIIIITALAVLVIGFFFARSTTEPLIKTVHMIQEMANGHLSQRLSLNRGDEIGVMASEMDQFADYLQIQVIGTMRKVADGEKLTTVTVIDEKDEIGPALEKMSRTLDHLTLETSNLTSRAAAGDLSFRGDSSGLSGQYKEIIDGFNQTLENIIAPVNETIRLSKEYANGNYTDKFDENIRIRGDFTGLKVALNQIGIKTVEALTQIKEQVIGLEANMEETNASLEGISAGSQLLAESTNNVSALSEKSTENVVQIQHTMEDLSTTVMAVAQRTEMVSLIAQKTNNLSIQGIGLAENAETRMKLVIASVNETKSVITQMHEQMADIIKIVDLITDIADQTNLLALNAAIEAARAGDAGRGFAVVAGEVKSLAQDSQRSAEHIASIITNLQKNSDQITQAVEESSKEARDGNTAVTDAFTAFTEIAKQVDEISKSMSEVAGASEEEAASVEEISASLSEIADFSKRIEDEAVGVAAGTEETSSALNQISNAVNLSVQALGQINQEMDRFKTE